MATSHQKPQVQTIHFQYLDSRKAHAVPELDADIKAAISLYGLPANPPYRNDYFSVEYEIEASGNAVFKILEAEPEGLFCFFCADRGLEILKFRQHLERLLSSSRYSDMAFVIKNQR